jgi:hypothetical protein
MSARWAGGDNFVLKRIGSLTGVDTGRERALADIQIYHLMPALDEQATSDVSVPRDASAFIINPDANRGDSYGWEGKNVGYKTDNESYDGSSTNTYWNQWKSGEYSSSLTQEITGLPAGKYTFSAILRGQNTATMTLSATANSISVSKTITGTGTTSPEGSPYANGWQVVTTDPIMVDNGQTLAISFEMTSSATAWWSADHFALTLVEIPASRTGITDLPESAATRQDVNSSVYDLLGRRIAQPSSQLKKGLYIINGRKVLIK